jgi:predicted secreted hydrolase
MLTSLLALRFAFTWACAAVVQFQPALPGYRFEFPRDYFSHPAYQTEWWYYTGNLQSADGQQLGFELTFFRQGVRHDDTKSSSWDLNDIYFAHFAISDLSGQHFFYTERVNRAGPGIAGASAESKEVWNGNWRVLFAPHQEHLTALAANYALKLSLTPQKPPVIHGENGISRKSAGPGRASHYFSETRLAASGSVVVNSHDFQVTGLAWMDHEFFTRQLAADQVGWEWLSIQLEDHTELMLFHIRRADGSIDPFSAGTYVDQRGHATHLVSQDFFLASTEQTWKSAKTGAVYPVHWKIRVPSLDLELDANTPLPSQELAATSNLAPSYWEGAMVFQGKRSNAPIRGSGYLEMTGYDRPIAARQF